MSKNKGIIIIRDVTKKNPHHLSPGAHKKYTGKMTSGFYVEFQGLRTGTGTYCYDDEELMIEVGWLIINFSFNHKFEIKDKRLRK